MFRVSLAYQTFLVATFTAASLLTALEEASLAASDGVVLNRTAANAEAWASYPLSNRDFTYKIPNTDLLIRVGSGEHAQTMSPQTLNSLIDNAIDKAENDALKGPGGLSRPIDVNPAFTLTLGNLAVYVFRWPLITDFTYAYLLLVLIAIRDRLYRIDYLECLTMVAIQRKDSEAERWIGFVNINVTRDGTSLRQ